jgi:DNA-binding XRE family transcriptional regulator
MNAEQFKMAKAALGLSNPELADKTGLHRNTLNKLDKGEGKASTSQHVQLTLEKLGIQFLESGDVATGPGVALRVQE